MRLKRRANSGEVEAIDVIDEDDRVRVAHGHTPAKEGRPRQHERSSVFFPGVWVVASSEQVRT